MARTARNWANFVFMRYGLPPAVRGRPRPGGGYEAASASAMAGEWHPTADILIRTGRVLVNIRKYNGTKLKRIIFNPG